MALWELDEFQGPAFLGYVREVPEPEGYSGQQWLPNQTVNDLEFQYIKGVRNRAVMAHVMGFDSEAPIEGRPGLGERVQGELPPIKRKAKFSEKEIIRFLQPRAGTADKQQAIDSVYDVTDRLLESVHARVEWLRMKALSEDTVVYDEGGIIFEFDYGLNDELQFDFATGQNGAGETVDGLTGVGWDNIENADPLSDLQVVQHIYEQITGRSLDTMPVSKQTMAYLRRNANLRGIIRGPESQTALLTSGEVQNLLDEFELPTLQTYDVSVVKENADGSYAEERTMAINRGFGTPDVTLGNTLWGPTAESRSLIGTTMAQEAPGIIGVTYATEEPPAEWVKVAAVAFPTMPDAHLLAQFQFYAATP